MRENADRYLIPALIGFSPVVLALLTWDPNGVTGAQSAALTDAAPVFAVEVVAFVVAVRGGLVSWIRENAPPLWATAALAVWFTLAIATALLVAPDRLAAVRWTAHWIMHLLFGFAIAFLCSRAITIRDLVATYLAGFVIYCLIILIFAIINWGRPIDWPDHLPGVLNIRHAAIYAAAIDGMAIGFLAAARSRVARFCTFLVMAIGFAMGWWTGSRGMLLSVVGATVIGAILLPPMRSAKVLAAALVSLGIGMASVAWIPVPNGAMMGVSRTIAITGESDLSHGRLAVWTRVIHAIAQRPVFGYGAGQMPSVAASVGVAQPHNLVLQVLLDWGFLGVACVAAASVFYCRRAVPRVRANARLLAAPLIAMFSLLLLSMVDAAMYHVLPVSIFAACAGMIASQGTESETRQSALEGYRDATKS